MMFCRLDPDACRLFIGAQIAKNGRDDRQNGRQHIRQSVHGIQHDSIGMYADADDQLGDRQQKIVKNKVC